MNQKASQSNRKPIIQEQKLPTPHSRQIQETRLSNKFYMKSYDKLRFKWMNRLAILVKAINPNLLFLITIYFILLLKSMKTQKYLSPTKENLSPVKQANRTPQTIADFLELAKASGLKIPSALQKKMLQGKDGLLKVKSIQTKDQDVKKLKVKLGDTQFELKKLEEDFAQYKLTSRQEKERQVKKWQQSYNKLKSTLEDSNQDSSLKLIKLKQCSEKEINGLKEKHIAQLEQQTSKLRKSYEDKLESQKKMRQRQIRELKIEHGKQLKQITDKFQGEIEETQKIHEFEIRKQALKHKDTLDSKEKQFESIYTALQSEKKTEEKLHEKTKVESSQAKQKLYADLYLERNLKKGLQEQVARLEKDIRTLKSVIKDLETDIHIEKQRGQKKEKALKQEFQIQLQGREEVHKQKLASILCLHKEQLSKYQQKIEQLDEWKKNSEKILEQKIEEIEKVFNNRPSRKEDLDMIDKMRSKLLRKEEDVRVLNKELKACALEIQNKEQTYNRIFTSNTVNKFEKKSLTRDRQDFKSRESLSRKSQTTDLKFLLKVYNKHI